MFRVARPTATALALALASCSGGYSVCDGARDLQAALMILNGADDQLVTVWQSPDVSARGAATDAYFGDLREGASLLNAVVEGAESVSDDDDLATLGDWAEFQVFSLSVVVLWGLDNAEGHELIADFQSPPTNQTVFDLAFSRLSESARNDLLYLGSGTDQQRALAIAVGCEAPLPVPTSGS